MKKLTLILCLFAAAALGAQSHADKKTADEINSNMESFREYKWGDQERPYEAYIYSVYYTGTSNRADGAKIEAKAVNELKEGKGNLRYKMLLAQTLEIIGLQNSAEAVAEIINKASADPKNINWVERLFNSLTLSSDKNAKKALISLLKSNVDYVRICAIASFGDRGEGDAEIATILKPLMTSGFKDRPLANACIMALSKIGSDNAIKFLYETYKKASAPDLKQLAADAFFSAASRSSDTSSAIAAANEMLADKNAPLGVKISAYACLFKLGKALKPSQPDFMITAIDMIRANKDIAVPDFLVLSKLEEPMQTLMVQALTARGEGYPEIIKLAPKSAELAEAITYAASKMGSEKDYQKLFSFAPLYDKKTLSKIGYYVAGIKVSGKVLKLSALSKGSSSEVSDLINATIENIDSSSSANELLDMLRKGSKEEKIFAVKALGTALEKNDEVFIKVAKMYPSLADDAQVVPAAQRLLVNCSRVRCTQDMFNAAKEQFDLSKDPKTKVFFLRFAAPYGGKDAAEFLGAVYQSGLKQEALAELAKWKSEDAFPVLQKLEKADAANKQKIRDVMVGIVQQNNFRESPILQYISSTATNSKEKNLINLIEMPNFAALEYVNLPGGVKGKATRSANNLKNAFDGDISTRWDSSSSREPGIGIMFVMPDVQNVKGVELLLGSSGGDRVLDPIVFAGESDDDMTKVKIKYSSEKGKDVITFDKPMKAKVICVVNNKAAGGFWSIHEVNVVK